MQFKTLETVSIVDALVDALRARILDGDLESGSRLRETELARQYGVARNSLRAALDALGHEGLVERVPRRGVFVAALSAADVRDVFRLRAALELEAMRLLIRRRTPPTVAFDAVAELEALSEDASWRAVVEADMRFHLALIQATDSTRIARAYARIHSEIRLCLVNLRVHYDRASEVAAEHRALLEPILAGDEVEAERRLRIHFDDAEQNLTSELANAGALPSRGSPVGHQDREALEPGLEHRRLDAVDTRGQRH
jgi:DNA-binding GntR family transcriptional regulator